MVNITENDIWNSICKDFKFKLENNKGLEHFVINRSKFEGWVKVELSDSLYLLADKIIPEKDNIDLLIVDNANKVVIAIENKVYANERSDGKDGGQLKNYCKIVDENYKNFKNKIFIYLTIDGLSPESEENQKIWLNATHEMIGEAVEDVLEKQTILPKAEMILTTYVDLLT